MPDRLDDFLLRQRPTAEHPLRGLTVLVVEDSRFASEALRLMCLRSGARVRRADSLSSAARHLASYRPCVALVDMGLPDGSGTDLIAELVSATPPVPAVIAISGDPGQDRAARDAGAHGFLAKPLANLAAFQQTILDHLPDLEPPPGPRAVPQDRIAPDRIAFHDDLAHAAETLSRAPDDPGRIGYVAQFLHGVAHSVGDAPLENAARALSDALPLGDTSEAMGRIIQLMERRLDEKAVV